MCRNGTEELPDEVPKRDSILKFSILDDTLTTCYHMLIVFDAIDLHKRHIALLSSYLFIRSHHSTTMPSPSMSIVIVIATDVVPPAH